MRPWVLFDISCLAYRAWYTMGGLQHDGDSTGVLYGVLEQLRRACESPSIASNRAVCFFDSRQSRRKRQYRLYKRGRQGTKRVEQQTEDGLSIADLRKQIQQLHDVVLPSMGIQVLRQTGLEADDLIAKAAQQLEDEDVRGEIVSTDNDLLQCVSVHVHLYNPGKYETWNREDVIRKKGVTPHQWALVKVLGGCTSDEVPGIPGVGGKTAVDYLRGLLPVGSKRFQSICSGEHQDILERNWDLVVLPHDSTQAFKLREPVYRGGSGFWGVCERFGFGSYLNGPRRRDWERFFEGRPGSKWPSRKRKGVVYGR